MSTKLDNTAPFTDLGTNHTAVYSTEDSVAPSVQPTKSTFTQKDTIESMKPIEIKNLENDPKGFFVTLYQRVINTIAPYLGIASTTAPQPTKPSMTKQWLEEEIAKLRQEIESEEIHLDRFIQRVALLAGLSFFHTSQAETEGERSLRDDLQRMMQEYRAKFSDNKVFAIEMCNGIFSVVGGIAGIKYDASVAVQTISGAGQSASKLVGNSVDGDKAINQLLIEQMKQTIENARNLRSMCEQQSTKMEDQRQQAAQSRQQIIADLTR